MKRTTLSILAATGLAALLGAATGSADGNSLVIRIPMPNEHQANLFAAHTQPANNDYGDPWAMSVDSAGVYRNRSKCGSFTAGTFKLASAYGGATWVEAILESLTGEKLPHADHWYDAFDRNASNYWASFATRDGFWDWRRGDVMAAKYDGDGDGDGTGHVMTLVNFPASGDANNDVNAKLGGTYSYLLTVVDSSTKPHGDLDSRKATGDRGVGKGPMRVYVNAAGELVAWQWSDANHADLYFAGATSPVANLTPGDEVVDSDAFNCPAADYPLSEDSTKLHKCYWRPMHVGLVSIDPFEFDL